MIQEIEFAADSLLERRRFELAVPPRSRARLAGRAGRFRAGRARPTLAMDVECPPHLSLSRTVGPLADQHPNCQVGLTRYRRTGTGWLARQLAEAARLAIDAPAVLDDGRNFARTLQHGNIGKRIAVPNHDVGELAGGN